MSSNSTIPSKELPLTIYNKAKILWRQPKIVLVLTFSLLVAFFIDTLSNVSSRYSSNLSIFFVPDIAVPVKSLTVDGGASANNLLMQFQSDILDTVVERPKITETTVMGVAYLAGICVGLWKQEDILLHRKIEKEFSPEFTDEKRERLYKKWLKAVERSKNWID